jgi:NAD(P) transhydrogenase subunit alpha
MSDASPFVLPAKAGTSDKVTVMATRSGSRFSPRRLLPWVMACAGMTMVSGVSTPAFAAGASSAVDPAIYMLMVFVVAVFVGYYVVWSVTAALHTPLMSVTNAISSVIIVGALLAVGVPALSGSSWLAKFFGFLAVVMAAINIFGGFLVTSRMLAMYKKKDGKK